MERKLTYQEKLLRMGKRQKKSAGKHVFIGLIICILFIVGFEFMYSPSTAEVDDTSDSEFTAAFVGDLMFGRHVKDVTDKYGYAHLFEKMAPIFDNADYLSGNFENPVLNRDEGEYEKIDKLIHLYTEAPAVDALKDANFSVLNIANNHMMDFGEEGLSDTISAMENADMSYVGAGSHKGSGEDDYDALKVDYQKINGLTVATLGYTDALVEGFSALGYRPGVARATPDNIFPMIEEANEEADLVFVNIHWGVEYDNTPHPRQKDLGRYMIEMGADAVIGHHSHVLSEIEQYGDGVIFYGLGNFIFDQGWTRTKDSAIVQYDLMKDGTGRFTVSPVRIRGAQPYVTQNKYYQMKIQRQLTMNQPKDNFEKEDGKLILEVDHSDILDKRGSDNE